MTNQASPVLGTLRPPQHTVDPRCRLWWACQVAGAGGSAAVVLIVLGVLLAPARPWLLWPGLLVSLCTVAGAIVVPAVGYRVHRWEVTDEAVYSRIGWWWVEWRAAPLSRVQTVDVERGPVQRLFGLATVTVTTASAKGPVRIEALDVDLATDIAERLTSITQRRSDGDAT